MSDKSGIQWTDATWNPVTGCTQIPGVKGRPSGCDHCYAKRLNDTRMIANPKSVRFGVPFETVLTHEDRLKTPSTWGRPRRIFVNSLSDLFHDDVPDEFIYRVYGAAVLNERHDFQILTKRPERMSRVIPRAMKACGHLDCELQNGPAENVWLGVSVSTIDDTWRTKMLRRTPAAVRFLSIEPLLGPVTTDVLTEMDWVIVGGESGNGWRPMDLAWARDLRNRCRALGIPFFFKQVAAQRPTDEMIPDDLRIREFPRERAVA